MAEATQGPWTAEGPDDFGDYNILPGNGESAAVAAVVSNLRPDDEVRANAAVVAASWQAIKALQLVCEMVERPPSSNCSCHIAPPCGDCVDYSGLREMFAVVDTAISAATALPAPLL